MSSCENLVDVANAVDAVEELSIDNLKLFTASDITVKAGLNNEDFDACLTNELKQWFDQFIKAYYKDDNIAACKEDFKAALLKDSRPYTLALKLFAAFPGNAKSKSKSILNFVFESISELHSENGEEFANTCTDNDRMVAFNFAKLSTNTKLHELVAKTYKLTEIWQPIVIKLKEMLLENNFKPVVEWSNILNVGNHFDIYDVILPLVFQRNIPLLYDFLSGAEKCRLPTVQFLDTLLDSKENFQSKCNEIIWWYNYSNVDKLNLNPGAMAKLLSRLTKKFDINLKYTPNLLQSRTLPFLRFLYRKYIKHEMTLEAWRELAVQEASQSQRTVCSMVHMIAKHNDIDEAIYWVNLFRIPEEKCPRAVLYKIKNGTYLKPYKSKFNHTQENTSSNDCPEYSNSSCESVDYLSLRLPTESIIFVDHIREFRRMLKHLVRVPQIAFDTEWKASVAMDTLALLQLATPDRVYLVDCLSVQLDERAWQLLAEQIFDNSEILKIAFALDNDLVMLKKLIPLNSEITNTDYLDMRVLFRRLRYMQVSFPFDNNSTSGEKLSLLTELCLGKKLDKINQISNWCKRPLRHEQIVYAALDAHCLLDIYQVIAKQLDELDLTIEDVMWKANVSKLKNMLTAKRNDELLEMKMQNITNRSARNTAFITDVMMWRLCKELRKLGIDCIHIPTENKTYKYMRMAKRDCRYILGRKSRRSYFSIEITKSGFINIPYDSIVNQVIHLLQYLNLAIDPINFHTRCLHCNCNRFIMATYDDMMFMLENQLTERMTNADEATRIYNKCQFNEYEPVIPYHPDHFSQHQMHNYETNQSKNWYLAPITEQIVYTRKTFDGYCIKINVNKLNSVCNEDCFYICNNCGSFTYENEHEIPEKIVEFIQQRSNNGQTSTDGSNSALNSI